MKKRAYLVFILILALALSACGGGASDWTSTADDNAAYPAANDETSSDDGWDSGDWGVGGVTGDWAMEEPTWENYPGDLSGERYLAIAENARVLTAVQQMLTFSLKVDSAAYTNVQRYIELGELPPADAVRTEELINYFSYDQELRFGGEHPFAVYTEVAPSPFDEDRYMAFVRVATPPVDRSALPSSNLTFLIDTSGSMAPHDRLPLLKDAFALLVEELDEDDVVSIVTYAGSSEVLLDSVSGGQKERILAAIHSLGASGSTGGEGGIRAAYALAEKNFMPAGNNRIILATDGDFNVGTSSLDELADLVAERRDTGVYLSILGFGMGNLRDDIMETLAAHGNGNYAYIGNLQAAQKVLVDELAANLFTVADDVKAQVEFNPSNVHAYRLIGYENRRMSNEDFRNDSRDAGEIGAGTDVVMMFELELYGNQATQGLKYTSDEAPAAGAYSDELFEVRIRYKLPGESEGREVGIPFAARDVREAGSSDFSFACSVAGFAHLLRDSEYAGDITVSDVLELAKNNLGRDEKGYRLDYLLLLRDYAALAA